MDRQDKILKPAIFVYISGNQAQNHQMISAILNGIEEEGLFYALYTYSTGDAHSLSQQAALASRLQVGIGIDNKHVALSYKRMATPLFITPITDISRKIGTNAARLVKQVPFV